jgi:hypothetical protein
MKTGRSVCETFPPVDALIAELLGYWGDVKLEHVVWLEVDDARAKHFSESFSGGREPHVVVRRCSALVLIISSLPFFTEDCAQVLRNWHRLEGVDGRAAGVSDGVPTRQ